MRIRRWKLYEIGIIWTIGCIIGVELIWVFDPLRLGNGIYWIDILEYVMRLLLVAPLIWSITAWNTLRQARTFIHWSRKIIGSAIITCSLLCMLVILFFPYEILWLGALYILALLFVLTDILVSDYVRVQKFPWMGTIKIIATVMVFVALSWPTPYQVKYPGITMNMDRYADLEEKPAHGEIMSVLIFDRPAVPMDWMYSKIFSQYELSKRSQSIGSIPAQLEVVRETKLDANQVAKAVALKEAGLEQDEMADITFTSYVVHEGGPSHGAMLTLALIDKLTPGGVTNGHVVAGTGTIQLDGTIGRIGGITQKAYTVSRTNADVFFVPASQVEAARKGAADLNIVPVNHIGDILMWLESFDNNVVNRYNR